jgi:mannosyltransferase OCH1-like enzyme
MISKILHYIWIGHGEKSDLIKHCIESWKKFLPDYEIKEWNEDNFNIDYNKFTRQSYDARKFAFTSDVIRLYALYTEGGVYLDTDVEVFKPLDEFLNEPAFTGFEQPYYPVCATMGAENGNPLIKEMLDYYNDKEFKVEDDWTKYITNTVIMSDILEQHGIDRSKNEIQRIDDITIYPKEYFLDQNGYTMHWMQGTWRIKEAI